MKKTFLPTLAIVLYCFGFSGQLSSQNAFQLPTNVQGLTANAAQSPFSDMFCSISGNLVAEHDPDFVGLFLADLDCTFCGGGSNFLAVPFTATSSVIINDICISGVFLDPATLAPCGTLDFEVRIFDDNAGVPGTMIQGPTLITPTSILTGMIPIGTTEAEGLTIDFADVCVPAGETVWISLAADASAAPCDFGWSTSPTAPAITSSADGVTYAPAMDAAGLPISLTHFIGETAIEAPVLGGGPFEFCVTDGLPDTFAPGDITVTGGTGANIGVIVTDDQSNILALPPNSAAIDFEGVFPGTCLVWYISYADASTVLAEGANLADLGGCFELSNPLTVVRTECDPPIDPAIPTMGEWGLMCLGIMFMIVGIVAVRQRETAFQL